MRGCHGGLGMLAGLTAGALAGGAWLSRSLSGVCSAHQSRQSSSLFCSMRALDECLVLNVKAGLTDGMHMMADRFP